MKIATDITWRWVLIRLEPGDSPDLVGVGGGLFRPDRVEIVYRLNGGGGRTVTVYGPRVTKAGAPHQTWTGEWHGIGDDYTGWPEVAVRAVLLAESTSDSGVVSAFTGSVDGGPAACGVVQPHGQGRCMLPAGHVGPEHVGTPTRGSAAVWLAVAEQQVDSGPEGAA